MPQRLRLANLKEPRWQAQGSAKSLSPLEQE